MGLLAGRRFLPLVVARRGMRQRDRLNASRNIGFSATVSARALKLAGASFAFFFHHDGTSPHRIDITRLPSRSITVSIVSVGQML